MAELWLVGLRLSLVGSSGQIGNSWQIGRQWAEMFKIKKYVTPNVKPRLRPAS